MGGSLISAEGKPPEARLMLFPASKATIHDTWFTSGLCGTGSHDIEVHDLLVPRAFSVSPATELARLTSPLYAFPFFGLLALGIAAVTLGIARAAADEFARIASEKTPFGARNSFWASKGPLNHPPGRHHIPGPNPPFIQFPPPDGGWSPVMP